MLPNKPRGGTTDVFSMASSGSSDQEHPGVICRRRLAHTPLATTRARNRVERFFNRIKQCRRVATRYDRLAANYLAFVQLALIRLWLRLDESAS
jgi:hypothetical protein